MEQRRQWTYEEILADMPAQDREEMHLPPLSREEEAYRRGYHHGFVFSRSQPDVAEHEVRDWRNSKKMICPPGSPFEGKPTKASTLKEAIQNIVEANPDLQIYTNENQHD